MAEKAVLPSVVVFLFLNLVFFSLVSSHNVPLTPSGEETFQLPPLTCPKDALKLGVCANLLKNLLNLALRTGDSPKNPCCTLIRGLVDLEAAVCLCRTVKANITGININVSIALSLLLNYCGKNVPAGFGCL